MEALSENDWLVFQDLLLIEDKVRTVVMGLGRLNLQSRCIHWELSSR